MGDESINIADTGVGIDSATVILSGDGPPWPADSPRNHPHTGKYYLAVQPWDIVFSGRVTGWSDQMNITYDSGTFTGTTPAAGMTVMLLQDDGTWAYVRLKTAPVGATGSLEVSENDFVDWDYNKTVLVLNRFELWPVHPRVTYNGGITVYKDYDIAYTDQNEAFYPVPIMGPPAVVFLSGGTASITFSGEHCYTPDGSANSSWAWTFESGAPADANVVSQTVTWSAAGVYLVTMTITNAHGKSSTGYRYVYIFDRTGSGAPYTRLTVGNLSGSLSGGGWTCGVEVWEESIDKNDFPPGAQVILFAEEEWGGNAVVSKGMFIDRNNIKMVGWIVENTVAFNSETGSVSFQVTGIHALMKNCEIYSCALDSTEGSPTVWTSLKELNAIRAFHHLIYWQSTLMKIVDVFLPGQLAGSSPVERLPAAWDIKYQDFGDGSIWSQLHSLCEDAFCLMACDRCSTFYIGRDPQTIEEIYIGDVSTWLILTKTDWYDDADIQIRDEPGYAQVTLEGVQYDGGTDTATPRFSYAPGTVPSGRGQVHVRTGAVLGTEALSNILSGRLLAIGNNPLPNTDLNLLGNYGPCVDIAPFRWIRITLAAGDTPRAIVWTERAFLPMRVTDNIAVTQGGCHTDVSVKAYASGGSGVSVDVPEPEFINLFDTGEGAEAVWTDWPYIEDTGVGVDTPNIGVEGIADGVICSGWYYGYHLWLAGFTPVIRASYNANLIAGSPAPSGVTWDGVNEISSGTTYHKHYRHAGFSTTIDFSYAAPGTTPRGIDWDGTNVLSVEQPAIGDGRHYKHVGFSASINSSYTAPGSHSTGIAWDGTNALSADFGTDKHYKHSGFSASITSSYAAPGNSPWGLSWDGMHVLSVDALLAKHFMHTGFSASIADSYDYPIDPSPRGITWGARYATTPGNVLSVNYTTKQHFRHLGFSPTISASYTTPGVVPQGLGWDGTNVLSVDTGTDKHYKHTGFSAGITSSYTTPSTAPWGIDWDGANVISSDWGTNKHYRHIGFSASISDCYTVSWAPFANLKGITWDGTNVLSVDGFQEKHIRQVGFSSSISDSYTPPARYGGYGITWDGTNVISSDADYDKHYKQAFFSATVLSSYTYPGSDTTFGISWDNRYA